MKRPASLSVAPILLGLWSWSPGHAEGPAGAPPVEAQSPAIHLPPPAPAVDGAATGEPPAPDLWQRAREGAGDWWRRSRDLGAQAVEDARGMLGREPGLDQVWEGVVPKLQETLSLEERAEGLPERSWVGPDRVSNRAEIEELLDEAVELLSISPAQRFRERIRAIQGEIEGARADIAEYRRRRVSAPDEAALKRTVADYDRLIAGREADIERWGRELDGVKREFADAVRKLGLELSDDQMTFLLSTVVGDHMVDLGVLFDNVRSVTDRLEGLVAQSGEDLGSARRYYGMYVVLLRALRHLHLRVEESIGERYVPEIDSIVARAQALTGETLRLQRENPSKRELLAANLEAQRLTVEAAAVYRRYLTDQAEQVRRAREELDKDIAAAWNTYETVRVSGELVGLVRESRELLKGLTSRQVPPLRPFQSLEMRRELEKLTEELRGAR